MKGCDCKYWKENEPIIADALILQMNHGFAHGLTKIFTYCPWCGKKLVKKQKDKNETS